MTNYLVDRSPYWLIAGKRLIYCHGSEAGDVRPLMWARPCARRQHAEGGAGTGREDLGGGETSQTVEPQTQRQQRPQTQRQTAEPAHGSDEYEHAVLGWRRIVRHLTRLRRRQLYFAFLGHRLYDYPETIRSALVLAFPTGRQQELRDVRHVAGHAAGRGDRGAARGNRAAASGRGRISSGP